MVDGGISAFYSERSNLAMAEKGGAAINTHLSLLERHSNYKQWGRSYLANLPLRCRLD